AGSDRGIPMGGVENGAGTHLSAFDLVGNGANGIEGGWRAHGDFDRLQAACDKSTRQRNRGLDVIDDQNRYNRLKFQDGKELFCLFAHGRVILLKRLNSGLEIPPRVRFVETKPILV